MLIKQILEFIVAPAVKIATSNKEWLPNSCKEPQHRRHGKWEEQA